MYCPRYSLLCLSLVLSSFASAKTPPKQCDEKGPKAIRISARHIEGKGIGYGKGYTSLDLFGNFAERASPYYPFFDIRAHIFDDGRFAANGGFGLRYLSKSTSYVFGGNLFYDFRQSKHKSYNQIGMGLEALGNTWDFHVNGYVPVGKIHSSFFDPDFHHFEENRMILQRKRERAFYGVEAEAGAHVVKNRNFDLFTGAAPYYFTATSGTDAIGAKARIKGVFKDILGFELSGSYDTRFHGIVQGAISLSFPFGKRLKVDAAPPVSKSSCNIARNLKRRVMQPVERMEIIVLDNEKKRTTAIDPATGQPYFFVFVDNTSGSDGTFEDPYARIETAASASNPGDILYVFAGNPGVMSNNDTIDLKNNQRLWGSGTLHRLQTSNGEVKIPAQTVYHPEIITAGLAPFAEAIILANNNEISGFVINITANASGGIGILGDNISSARILDNQFRNFVSANIFAVVLGTVNGSVEIQNNRMAMNHTTGGTFTGMDLSPATGSATYDISGNIFTGCDKAINAVPFNDAQMTFKINNNYFADGGFGVRILPIDTTFVRATIQGNQFENMGFISGLFANPGTDINVITTGSAESILNIQNNNFTFAQPGTVIPDVGIFNSGSSTCLQFNNNRTFKGVYQFIQSAGTFNLVPPFGNTGTITTTGTITPVSGCD